MTAPADTPGGPLVVACLRITDLRPEVDPLGGSVHRDTWGIGLSAADGAALEHALRIGAAWSSRVVGVAVGPESIEPVLREVAALGVSAVRIAAADAGTEPGYAAELAADEHELARTVVAALGRWGRPGLVLCGDRSVDRGTGAFPAFLAHELGAAQALGLVALEVEAVRGGTGSPEVTGGGPDRALIAERRLDGGWRERLRVPLPAVCSVEGVGIRLRRASLPGVLDADVTVVPAVRPAPPEAGSSSQEGPVVRVGASRAFVPRTRVRPAPDSDDPRIRILALTGALVAHDPPTIVGPVGSAEAADALIGFLVRHGYLDRPPGTPSTPGTPGAGSGGER